jgi:hypothetical protein
MDFWSFIAGTFVGSFGVVASLLFGYMASAGRSSGYDD